MCISAVLSTALAAFGAYQQYESAQDARDQAKKAAEARSYEGLAQRGDLMEQQEARLSTARAIAAASGQKPGTGSSKLYMDEMQRQDRQRISYLDRVTASEVAAAKAGGKAAASQAKAGSLQTLASIPGYWT